MNTVASIITLVPGFLRAVADAPASSSFLTPSLELVLKAGAALIEAGDAGAQALVDLTTHIKAMATAGTDPTPDDWDKLFSLSNAAHATIQGTATTPPTLPPAT